MNGLLLNTTEYDKNDTTIPIGINKNVIGKFKDELNGKLKIELVSFASKAYADLDNNDKIEKRVKGIDKIVRDRVLKLENYMDVLLNKTIKNKQRRFKSEFHTIYTEQINKIALSRKDDKGIQTFDGITAYPYGTNAFKVCESEMLVKLKRKPIQLYY